MAETPDARVAVYLDFDNIVISWYDRVHGRNSYGRDRQRIDPVQGPDDAQGHADSRSPIRSRRSASTPSACSR